MSDEEMRSNVQPPRRTTSTGHGYQGHLTCANNQSAQGVIAARLMWALGTSLGRGPGVRWQRGAEFVPARRGGL